MAPKIKPKDGDDFYIVSIRFSEDARRYLVRAFKAEQDYQRSKAGGLV